jgi:hypothetical protein
MAWKKHSAEQIVALLRQIEVELANHRASAKPAKRAGSPTDLLPLAKAVRRTEARTGSTAERAGEREQPFAQTARCSQSQNRRSSSASMRLNSAIRSAFRARPRCSLHWRRQSRNPWLRKVLSMKVMVLTLSNTTQGMRPFHNVRQNRLTRVEASLTPKQAVLLWFREELQGKTSSDKVND